MRRKSTLWVAIAELLLSACITFIIVTAEKEWKIIPLIAVILLNLVCYGISYIFFISWWRIRNSKMRVKVYKGTTALMYEKDFIILN